MSVLYEQSGHVVTLTINRPEALNAIDPETHDALIAAWTRFRDDDSAWVADNWVEKLKTTRLTLTAKITRRAAHRLFLVCGEDKAAVLAEVLNGPPHPKRLPSQMVLSGAGQTTFFIDRAAAGT